jgi:hypothetical protein
VRFAVGADLDDTSAVFAVFALALYRQEQVAERIANQPAGSS